MKCKWIWGQIKEEVGCQLNQEWYRAPLNENKGSGVRKFTTIGQNFESQGPSEHDFTKKKNSLLSPESEEVTMNVG